MALGSPKEPLTPLESERPTPKRYLVIYEFAAIWLSTAIWLTGATAAIFLSKKGSVWPGIIGVAIGMGWIAMNRKGPIRSLAAYRAFRARAGQPINSQFDNTRFGFAYIVFPLLLIAVASYILKNLGVTTLLGFRL
jgi:hypothetical protein